MGQELHRLRQRVEGQQCCGLRLGQREQFQGRGGDNAEGAFAADVQVAQVVARVVLAQATQAIPDFTFGGHHFQPQRQLAGIAVAQHGSAAGVGAEITANRATAFGAQTQGKQATGVTGNVLHVLQNTAGFDGQRVVVRVHGAYPVQAIQQQQHRTTPGVRRGASH
ncbi:hypothetical protein D3C86_1460520 [compost metagenome]